MVIIGLLGLNGQNNEGRSLLDKGSTNREKMGAKRLIKSFRTGHLLSGNFLWQVWIVWLKTRQHSYWVHLKVLRVLTTHPATAPEILLDCCSDRY